jgi:quercetin dioxygenase-like cupin family protein
MNTDIIIVDTNALPWEAVQRGRVNMIRRKRLPVETGVPGLTVEYSISVVPEGYFTPRHRHNFDQIRYTLTGLQSTAYGDLAPGECGYFPEGAYYGPQKQDGECVTLVLQFQGASLLHFLSNEEMNATYQKMIADGAKFENGVYTAIGPKGRKVNKDSYLAIWEEHEGKKMTFPKARYRTPVMMMRENYNWWPDRERPGVETKHLGTFTELRTGIGFFRLAPGARIPAHRNPDAQLVYLEKGAMDYAGKTWGEGTYMYVPPGAELAPMSSAPGAMFFTITLPMVAEIAARQGLQTAQAAE